MLLLSAQILLKEEIMMFVAFALSLIALTMGATLVLKAKKNADLGTGGCKFIGYIVGILAIIMLLLSGFTSSRHVNVMFTSKGPHRMMLNVQKPKCMKPNVMKNKS